jgi:eukaryotic-like serine/threonine-protein kinase
MQPLDVRSAALRDLLPGRVLEGTQGARYHLHECIGEGGQGWVFAASWNEPGGYRVVVKVLRPAAVTSESLSRFEREAQVLRMLGQAARPNPHIVRFFDHARQSFPIGTGGETIELPFTVLEHVAGPTLEAVLAQGRGGGLVLDRTRRIGGQVALALEDVHAHKVVHRDLKPSNVLLASQGGVEMAKVTDFGLVKMVEIGLGRTTALAGATIGYAPPEQFERGNQRVTPRTDVFSFATMLYEMLTGARAFPYGEGESPLVVVTRLLNGPRPSLARTRGALCPELLARPDLVQHVDAILAKATAAEPNDRHATIGDLWGALDRVLRAASEPAFSSPPPPDRLAMSEPRSVAASRASNPLVRTARESAPPRDDAQTASPASWQWRVRVPSVHAGAARAATFDPVGSKAYAIGTAGVMVWKEQTGWVRLAPPLDDGGGSLGLAWLGEGQLLAFGARAFVARVGPDGRPETWALPRNDVTFRGCYVDDRGTVTLVGEQPAPGALRGGVHGSSAGIIAQFVHGKLTLLSDVPTCAGLRGVTRLRTGNLVACGDWGALVSLELGVVAPVGAICAGHLNAIRALPDGGAVTIGAGGHALSLSPRLEPQLEAVQTTRDLFALAVDPNGVAWGGSAQARLLRRSGGSWVRMTGELGLASSIAAVWAGPRAVRAVCDDGAVIEGVVVGG